MTNFPRQFAQPQLQSQRSGQPQKQQAEEGYTTEGIFAIGTLALLTIGALAGIYYRQEIADSISKTIQASSFGQAVCKATDDNVAKTAVTSVLDKITTATNSAINACTKLTDPSGLDLSKCTSIFGTVTEALTEAKK